ncbi:MAG: ATP-binding protein [Chloroflexota bacterium]
MGLGLAVAQAAAQRHGGYIRVESKEGEGSTFYLILPAATESEA